MNDSARARCASALAALATALGILTCAVTLAVALPEAHASPRTAKPIRAAITPKADFDSLGPVYRFVHRRTGASFLTASEAERDVARRIAAFVDQGIAFFAYPGGGTGALPVFRFFNRATGAHFYTIFETERDFVLAALPDLALEGVVWHAFTAARAGTSPVRRFYATATGMHVYTIDAAEAAALAARTGYIDEGVAFHAFVSQPLPAIAAATTDAARFLTQATFGLRSVEAIEALKAQGYSAWLDAEFARPMTSHLDYLQVVQGSGVRVEEQHAYEAIWQQMFDADDQLRTRLAFALSQIIVISNVAPDQDTWALASWMDMLKRNAFANYRQLLEEATLHPAMGYYLNMLRNAKEDPARGRMPNENYAREVLQLFSIGLTELNADGTQRLGNDGKPIPTYDQSVVEGFAKVFTGWSFGGGNVADAEAFHHGGENWVLPMAPWPQHHSPASKKLLRGVVLPAGQAPAKDLKDALDNIFAHPNVGPFIGRRLIQFLVTSNPSPAYIQRVTAAFDDNGGGVRGDMKAVVRAILLDPEARDLALAAGNRFGKLREPVLRFTALMRALNARAQNGRNSVWWLDNPDDYLGQSPLIAPSVFNFFSPNYVRPGALAQAGLVAPEFQITTETQVVGSSNFFHYVVADGGFGFKDAGRRDLDFAPLATVAHQSGELVDRLNLLLCTGQMSAATRAALVEAVEAIPAGERLRRVKAALFLTLVSPDFAVQR